MKRATVLATIAVTAGASCLAQQAADGTLERVIALKHASEPADLQALILAGRMIADIREASADGPKRTLAFRGTADQLALVEWLIAELDRAGPGEARELRVTGDDAIVRIFYIRNNPAVETLQEVATVIRSTANIRRAFAYNSASAIAVRGTAEQVALADWLLEALDQPARAERAATPIYRASASSDDVARVFYLASRESVADTQSTATLIRSLAEIPRLFQCRAPRALAARATAEQLGAANWLLTALDRPGGVTEYTMPASGDRIRLFWLPQSEGPELWADILTAVRARSGTRKIFIHTGRRALAVRGTAEQIAAAEQAIGDAGQARSTAGR